MPTITLHNNNRVEQSLNHEHGYRFLVTLTRSFAIFTFGIFLLIYATNANASQHSLNFICYQTQYPAEKKERKMHNGKRDDV